MSGVLEIDGNLRGILSVEGTLGGSLSADPSLEGTLSVGGFNTYAGDYEVTPSDETQVLRTANMITLEDIIINAIPSNYGLIAWNGSALTVS